MTRHPAGFLLSKVTRLFLVRWGVYHHCVISAYNQCAIPCIDFGYNQDVSILEKQTTL